LGQLLVFVGLFNFMVGGDLLIQGCCFVTLNLIRAIPGRTLQAVEND
jgi:hypothetical protein